MIAPPARMKTPPARAKELGVSPEKIVGFIKSGELAAIDVSLRPGVGRPRYRIRQDDWEAFLLRRSVVVTPKPKRRRKRDPNVTEYF